MSERSSLGATLLTPHGERIRKGILNIVCFLIFPGWVTTPSGLTFVAVENKESNNSFLVHGMYVL